MVEISEVPGITGSTLELFKAAGIVSVEILLANDVPKILAALDRANAAYEVAVRAPSADLVRAWQDAGRAVLRKRAKSSPAAYAVSKENLRAAGIDVDAVPVAKVVEVPPPKPVAPAEAPKGEAPPPPPSSAPLAAAAVAEAAAPAPPATAMAEKSEAEPNPAEAQNKVAKRSRRKKGSAKNSASKKGTPRKPASTGGAVEREAEVGADSSSPLPTQSINTPPSRRLQKEAAKIAEAEVAAKRFRELEKVRLEKEQGQRRNRGMSHPDATRVRWAATVTVLAPFFSLIAAGILLWALIRAQFYGDHFHPTIALLLLIFPIALFLYLGIGTKARCRLCGQKLFVPKHCRKHERASKSIFGYTFAVARNAMLFANYRCMLCGTKTRLKD